MEQGCEATKTARGMAHYAVRTYPGWYHPRRPWMLAHVCLGHLQRRVGKKSSSPDGVTPAPLVGGDPALTPVDGGGGSRTGGVAPAGPAPGVSVAQQAS